MCDDELTVRERLGFMVEAMRKTPGRQAIATAYGRHDECLARDLGEALDTIETWTSLNDLFDDQTGDAARMRERIKGLQCRSLDAPQPPPMAEHDTTLPKTPWHVTPELDGSSHFVLRDAKDVPIMTLVPRIYVKPTPYLLDVIAEAWRVPGLEAELRANALSLARILLRTIEAEKESAETRRRIDAVKQRAEQSVARVQSLEKRLIALKGGPHG